MALPPPTVKYERIKFLVIALKNSVEIYAWAPKPYHKFMAFKVRRVGLCWDNRRTNWRSAFSLMFLTLLLLRQSFTDLQHRPQLVDLTVEEGQRLKVIYGSSVGFHVIDVDSGNPYDIYIPSHVSLCVCVCVSADYILLLVTSEHMNQNQNE